MNPELIHKTQTIKLQRYAEEVWHVCFMWFLISILEEEVLWPLGAYYLTPKNWKIIKHLALSTAENKWFVYSLQSLMAKDTCNRGLQVH